MKIKAWWVKLAMQKIVVPVVRKNAAAAAVLVTLANGVLEGKSLREATTKLNTVLTLIDLFQELRVELTPSKHGLVLRVDLTVNGAPRKSERF